MPSTYARLLQPIDAPMRIARGESGQSVRKWLRNTVAPMASASAYVNIVDQTPSRPPASSSRYGYQTTPQTAAPASSASAGRDRGTSRWRDKGSNFMEAREYRDERAAALHRRTLRAG